ncbi:MAG: hypothetical protein RR410_06150 [Alistipes sp.]
MNYSILPALYQQTAARLCDAIDGQDYFSGTVSFLFEDVECRLTTSVIVYRQLVSQPEGIFEPITNLIPVWWEFHTCDAEGEQLNDFDFSELKSYVV